MGTGMGQGDRDGTGGQEWDRDVGFGTLGLGQLWGKGQGDRDGGQGDKHHGDVAAGTGDIRMGQW